MTLWDEFVNSTLPLQVRWKIYGRNGKLICADYGSLKNDDVTLDDSEVYKAELKVNKKGDKYVRVVIEL
jgi:hypothetical protein